MPAAQKIIPTRDFDDVITVVRQYTDGLQAGDADATLQAFRDDAVMFGFTNGELFAGSVSLLHDFISKHGAAPAIRVHLDVLSITETAAVVRVDMENDSIGTSNTDFHSLLKEDGVWKIAAKTFHQYGN